MLFRDAKQCFDFGNIFIEIVQKQEIWSNTSLLINFLFNELVKNQYLDC